MDPTTIGLIITLLGLVLKHGAPFIKSLIEVLHKDEITLEDIQGLKLTMKPEDFGDPAEPTGEIPPGVTP